VIMQKDYAGKYLNEKPSLMMRIINRSIYVPQDAETFADVSFYQAGMNWNKYPHRAAILRAGQNIWVDSEFERNYAECVSRGIIVGGYWFYDDRVSPQVQARAILDATGGKIFQMEFFVDYERKYGGEYFGLKNVKQLIELIEGGIASKGIGIYTGYYFWNENTVADKAYYSFFASRPLWLAWYADAGTVRIPQPWTTWTHWQYGTPTVDWGQPTKEIDANRHNGTRAEFEARYGIVTVPPTTGGNMLKGTLKSTTSLKIRSGPSTAYPQIDGIYTGDTVYGVLDSATNWLHVSRIVRANGAYRPIDGWCSAAYLDLVDVPETGEITVTATLKSDGTVVGTWTRK
jgi:GH25 family lysozyme M1 (1,4-beta-N-acetylmuramidase)